MLINFFQVKNISLVPRVDAVPFDYFSQERKPHAQRFPRERIRARDSESSSCKVDKASPPPTRFCASNHSLFVLIMHRATSSAFVLFNFHPLSTLPCLLAIPSFQVSSKFIISDVLSHSHFFFFFYLIRQSESGSASFPREENVSRHTSFHKLLTRISTQP